MKSVFEENTRLRHDDCDKESRELQNNDAYKYTTFNNIATNQNTAEKCKSNRESLLDFSLNNYMNIRDGYGFTNACGVDTDSKVRNDFEMHDKGKQQLNSRVFVGGPNANKGGLEPGIDSKLTQGTFVSKKETCDVLSERNFDRFEPMPEAILKSVQDPEHIVPKWTWGGEPTRDVLSQRDFLEKNGYEHDGKTWKKC